MMSSSRGRRHIATEEPQTYPGTSTLSVQTIAEELDVTTEDTEKVLAITTPLGIFSHQLRRFIHLVWGVRDVINDNTKGDGQTPKPYTHLEGEREDYWLLR